MKKNEDIIIGLFNSFPFSSECKLVRIEYSHVFFGNFLIEIQCKFLLYRIVNDRGQLFIETYDNTNKEWCDIGFTEKINQHIFDEILCRAFAYIDSL